jgi:hypothetical protein
MLLVSRASIVTLKRVPITRYLQNVRDISLTLFDEDINTPTAPELKIVLLGLFYLGGWRGEPGG